MKNLVFPLILLFILFNSCKKTPDSNLLKYVDITIGTAKADTQAARDNPGDHVDYGQTIPAITAPFGMTQWTPQNRLSETKCVAPYYMDIELIQGFRATHWTNGSCVQDYGSFTLMPVSGYFDHRPSLRHAKLYFERKDISPAYGIYHIPEYMIIAELTATRRCGFFRFSYADPTNAGIVIDVNSDEGVGYIKIDPERREIIAANPVHRIYSGHGKSAGFSGYMVIRFDTGFKDFGTYTDYQNFSKETELSGMPKLGAYILFNSSKDDVVNVKIGTSFTSIEKARENLDSEIPDWDFDRVRSNLETTWEQLLGRIRIEGGTDQDLTQFYSAVYRSCLHPRLFSDVDGSYVGFAEDTVIHKAEGFDYYCDFSAWDTYRAQMPLLSIIAPKEYEDMTRSLVKKAEQGGWLPIFPMWNSYTSAMIGDHCGAILGDAIMKGFNPDKEAAWKYMRKNAFETPSDYQEYLDGKGRRALRTYMEYGYIPLEDEVLEAFHQREQVSRTLEYAYNDWVLSQVAGKLNYSDDAAELKERARNYVNVFDPDKGWVNGRHIDGVFTSDFNADKSMPWITEGTPKHYTWYVPHDVDGLIDLMDGKENFLSKLQEFVDNREYWHGNEPSHHIPYLFNFAGRWDLTQKTVTHLLETEYSATKGGLSGNDDAGQMSAWYVFSSMGFYPVCPGSNEYQLAAPLFKKITLNLDKNYYPGQPFEIIARRDNPNAIFSKVKLNNQVIGTSFLHKELQSGGKLVFVK